MGKKITLFNIFVFCLLILFAFSCNNSNGKKEVHGIDPANMDLTADPAKDFYQYANGGWLARSEIPESESRWGTFNELIDKSKQAQLDLLRELAAKTDAPKGSNAQKVGDFYKSGMDSLQAENDGISPLADEFAVIDAIKNTRDLLKVVARHQRYGTGSLFGFFAMGDLKNSDIYAAYAYQGGLGLPDRDYYLDSGEKFVNIRKEYLGHIQKMFELMGERTDVAKKAPQTIMAIETRLAKASMTRVEQRDLQKLYNKKTVAEASKITPRIDWVKHVQSLGVADLDYFIMAQPDFFKEVNAMLKDVSIEDWKTYLRWHLLTASAPFLSSKFVDEDFRFYRTVLRGTPQNKPRWKRVVEQTDAALGEALGQLYVDKYFPGDAKAKANELVNNLRAAYAKRIENVDWMSDATKAKAKEKLAAVVQKIGYPDKWRDYSALEIDRGPFVLNVMRSNAFEFDRTIHRIGQEVDKSEWRMTPPTVNAGYNPLNNEIIFPAGILQPPFFDPKADDASNYGGIGYAIGHELTHGFDDQGSRFDAAGNMTNWWTEEDRQKFDARTKMLAEQFDQYTVLDSVHVNGKLTLGENIADLGGIAVAFDALQIALEKHGRPGKIDGFTPEQRFFIACASVWRGKIRDEALLERIKTDPHSPAMVRGFAPMTNTPPFFAAFDIKPGEPMRRPDSLLVKIW